VFRAEIDGKPLDFDSSSSGFGLRGMNFVMRDRDTGSAWQQATGEAFEGPLKGKRLTIVPFEITTWGEWRTRYPQTMALVPEARFEDQYRLMAQRVANLLRSTTPREATLRATTAAGRVVDTETGSTWTPYGECVAGSLKGERLESITPLPSFWFSWAQFYPDTEVYRYLLLPFTSRILHIVGMSTRSRTSV
jgi:hypothetical protein